MEKKGTLFVYDSFEEVTTEQLEHLFDIAEERCFELLVLYPLHELTLKRMGFSEVKSYGKRCKELESLAKESNHPMLTVIDYWEGKRKKYTPIETSLQFLQQKYSRPNFLYVDADYAYQLASYNSFERWIREVRMIIDTHGKIIEEHPKLQKYRHRVEII